jgi:hypothetical protein
MSEYPHVMHCTAGSGLTVVYHRRKNLLQDIGRVLAGRNPQGMVHYKDLVQALGDNGVMYRDVKQEGKNVPFSGSQYTNIVQGRRARKPPREHYNAHRLTEEIKALIADFWLSDAICRVSPSIMCTMQRKTKDTPAVLAPVYFRQCSIAKAFQLFKDQHPDIKCGRSSFYKYKPKNVKRPRSRFDVCTICKEADKHQEELQQRRDTPGSRMSIEEIETLDGMKFHREMVSKRYLDAKHQLENIQEGQCILTMDFKANVTLGKGPQEDSRVWFSAPQRTIFGVAAYFKKGETVYKVMFTVISSILMHDTKTVIEILNSCVLNHALFDYFSARQLIFWMDNAPNHFRTKEMLAGFHDIQQQAAFDSVEVNYFAEYHGKSECDRHFGLISRIYTDHCSKEISDDVETTDDFVRVYRDHLLEHGSQVIPSVGAQLGELLPLSDKKLNVVCAEFSYEGISLEPPAQTSEEDDEESSTERSTKTYFQIPMPYERRSLKEKSAFTFSNFYSFSFRKERGQNVMLCKLHHRSRAHRIKYDIKTAQMSKYCLKVGIASSAQRRYVSVKRSYRRFRFHRQVDASY